MLRSGECGELLSISATVWQGWGPGTAGKWRQQPEISGGGFMFDTGAHMLNTVADLGGAWPALLDAGPCIVLQPRRAAARGHRRQPRTES